MDLLSRAMMMGGQEPPISFSFVASSSSQSDIVSYPAGTQAGDLAILFDWVVLSGTWSTRTPTGFTLVASSTLSGNANSRISYRVVQTADLPNPIQGSSSDGTKMKTLMVFRTSRPATAFTFVLGGSTVTSADPAPQTLSSNLVPRNKLVFGHYGTSTGRYVYGEDTVVPMTGAQNPQTSYNGIFGSGGFFMIFVIFQTIKFSIESEVSNPVTVDLVGDFGTNALQSFYVTAE